MEDLSQIPEAVMAVLEHGARATGADTSTRGDPTFHRHRRPPEAQPEFKEEQPTPPPQRPQDKTCHAAADSPANFRRCRTGFHVFSTKRALIFIRDRSIPTKRVGQKKTGSGVCVLTFDPERKRDGRLRWQQSTGSPILDNATTSAFKRWRFKPGTVSPRCACRLRYTMTGRAILGSLMKVSSPIPKKHARIEIIPLIDIMFFLLASFMMVSLSQTHMKGIRVNLPAPSAQPQDPTNKDYIAIRGERGQQRLLRRSDGCRRRSAAASLRAASSQPRDQGFSQRRRAGAARRCHRCARSRALSRHQEGRLSNQERRFRAKLSRLSATA